jgi:hypothetical protein
MTVLNPQPLPCMYDFRKRTDRRRQGGVALLEY